MGLIGKLVDQIEIHAVGDLFHDSFKNNPVSLTTMTPEKLHTCDLHDGEFGVAGSCIAWNYTHDGKKKYAKQIIDVIDEEKKSIVFRMVEGDLMEEYKSFTLTYHVDDTGNDNHLVTWTLDYEKLNENISDPVSLLKFCLDLSKDIADHHIATPTT